MEGERERDPGRAIKTKDMWGEAPGRQETQKHRAEGPIGRGWRERGWDSPREGQNDEQGQGHRPRAKAGERGGRGKDVEMGRDREEKTDKARETEKRREQGWARQGQQDGGTGTVADRSRYERLIAPSACYMLDLLRVLTASSWQPQD